MCFGGSDGKGGHPEKVVNVNHEVPHVFNAVNLRFSSTLDEGMENESWGIRQFFLHIAKCATNCIECSGPLDADCTACVAPFVIKDGKCTIQGEWSVVAKDFNDKDIPIPFINDWVIKNTFKETTDYVTECGGIKIVGGFEKFGAGAIVSRKFKNLPLHKRLRVTLEIWKIDSWNAENLWIKMENNIVWQRAFGWSDPGSMEVCGSTKADSG